MKKHLIAIKADNGAMESISINGDSVRPFQIAGNLWSYSTPWHAARKLGDIAEKWERMGRSVEKVYGTLTDMPIHGDKYNASMTLCAYEL